jgi:hypothetical protein
MRSTGIFDLLVKKDPSDHKRYDGDSFDVKLAFAVKNDHIDHIEILMLDDPSKQVVFRCYITPDNLVRLRDWASETLQRVGKEWVVETDKIRG